MALLILPLLALWANASPLQLNTKVAAGSLETSPAVLYNNTEAAALSAGAVCTDYVWYNSDIRADRTAYAKGQWCYSRVSASEVIVNMTQSKCSVWGNGFMGLPMWLDCATYIFEESSSFEWKVRGSFSDGRGDMANFEGSGSFIGREHKAASYEVDTVQWGKPSAVVKLNYNQHFTKGPYGHIPNDINILDTSIVDFGSLV